jgi:uncharacterized membrane protein
MRKNRLEAFSDGVIAIIITIMVLELKVPHGEGVETLLPLIPVFSSYVLSFVYLGIYWNNHIAYRILQQLIIASQGPDSILKKAIGGDWKGKLSPVLYAVAIPVAFWWRWASLALYVVVALLWLIPDRRIESILREAET